MRFHQRMLVPRLRGGSYRSRGDFSNRERLLLQRLAGGMLKLAIKPLIAESAGVMVSADTNVRLRHMVKIEIS